MTMQRATSFTNRTTSTAASWSPNRTSGAGILQRQCACGTHTMGGGECAGCTKNKSSLQRKLVIGASNDPLEQEADRIADQVMARPARSSVKPIPSRIQRFSGYAGGQTDPAPSSVDRVLVSPGRPLEPALREDVGQRFGYDFSRVRVHTDAKAAESARTVEASAYTIGNDIVFGAGQYAPGTNAGRRLLSHELAHVVQQNTSVGLTQIQKEPLSSPQDAAEGEAEAVVQHLSRGSIAPRATSVSRRVQPDTGRGKGASETPSFTVIDHGASPAAVKVAHERMAEIFGALRPGNLAQIKGLTVELHLIPHDKKLTDLPEYASLKGTKTFDGRLYDDIRGVGGMRVGNTIRYAVAEEELIAIPSAQGSTGKVTGAVLGGLAGAALGAAIGSLGGPVGALVGGLVGGLAGAITGVAIGKRKRTRKEGYGTGFVAGHETGHIVEQFALTKEQKIQLEKDYAERKKAGGPWLSPAWYTSSGSGEYFAQSTAAYFGRPYTETAADKAMYSREWLRKNDPAMYRLLTTVYK